MILSTNVKYFQSLKCQHSILKLDLCLRPVSSLCGIKCVKLNSFGRCIGSNFDSSAASEIRMASSVRIVRDPGNDNKKNIELMKNYAWF